jgi:integrase
MTWSEPRAWGKPLDACAARPAYAPGRQPSENFRQQLKREAYEAMRKAMDGLRVDRVNTAQTLKEFIDVWLPYHAKAKPLSPTTTGRYQSLAAHATRAPGNVALSDLTPFIFDDLYLKLGKTLSAKTIREVHNVSHVALKRSVKTKLIPFNPADGCELPRLDHKEAVVLSPTQLATFQQTAAGTWADLLIRLAAATGARRGELLACRWSDLDWNTYRLRIARSLYQVKKEIGIKPTKNRRARVVTIPGSLVEYLKLHLEQQQQNREMFGPDYRT